MVVHEQNHPKRTWLIVSLLLHSAAVIGLLTSLLEKKLTHSPFFDTALQEERKAAPVIAHQDDTQKEKEQEKKQRLPLPSNQPAPKPEEKPFVVPAPVVFYGNQPMMNLPTPIAGHADGKSSFDNDPSALPTPPTATISPERLSAPPSIPTNDTQETQEEQTVAPSPASELSTIMQPLKKQKKEPEKKREEKQESLEIVPASTTVTTEQEPEEKEALTETTQDLLSPEAPATAHITTPALKTAGQEKKAAKKQLTLADLFRNAPTALTAISQAGEPSAKKAGTEGGDVNGSGHQITIKEGDMKYYTLWAKFLNHLNQAARFNRRGKEHRLMELVQSGQITYVLQCGITVDMRGKLLDIEIIHSSGSKEFDRLCISDIKYAVPYPPLPESLGKKTARFEVNVYP